MRGYLTYTREEDERCSSVERDKTENYDTDTVQRRVHFEQTEISAKGGAHDSMKNDPQNTVRKVEETYLTEIPPSGTGIPPSGTKIPPSGTEIPPSGTKIPPSGTKIPPSETKIPPSGTKTRTSEEQQQSRRLSNSRQENQKSQNHDLRLSSEFDKNFQDNQDYPDMANDVTPRVPLNDKRNDKLDTKQITSSFDEQHLKSPR